ncbi:MAG: 3-dehydroquinate synthase, partial [Bacillota bacterium]
VRLGCLLPDELRELEETITAAGLPTELPEGITGEALLEAMGHDKKNTAGMLTLVLPRGLGQVKVDKGLPTEDILSALE